MSSVLPVLALGCVTLLACDVPTGPRASESTQLETSQKAPPTTDQLMRGIFPPDWKVGQTWVIRLRCGRPTYYLDLSCRDGYPGQCEPDPTTEVPDPCRRIREYQHFEVIAADENGIRVLATTWSYFPAGMRNFRYTLPMDPYDRRYDELTFRTRGFSLASSISWGDRWSRAEEHQFPTGPCINRKYLSDCPIPFPVMPGTAAEHAKEIVEARRREEGSNIAPLRQTVAQSEDGIVFKFQSTPLEPDRTFDLSWKHGDPWPERMGGCDTLVRHPDGSAFGPKGLYDLPPEEDQYAGPLRDNRPPAPRPATVQSLVPPKVVP